MYNVVIKRNKTLEVRKTSAGISSDEFILYKGLSKSNAEQLKYTEEFVKVDGKYFLGKE